MNTATNDVFSAAYNSAKQIPFVFEWSNGVGYFDYAVYGDHAPKLGNGEAVASVTPGGRRLIIIGTRLGNLAVFDRTKDQREGEANYDTPTFVYNTTTAIQHGRWFSSTTIDDYEMTVAVGDVNGNDVTKGNLGNLIEHLHSALKRS